MKVWLSRLMDHGGIEFRMVTPIYSAVPKTAVPYIALLTEKLMQVILLLLFVVFLF